MAASPGKHPYAASTGASSLGPNAVMAPPQAARTSVPATPRALPPGYDAERGDAANALALALFAFAVLLIERCQDDADDGEGAGPAPAVEDFLTDCATPGRPPAGHQLPAPSGTVREPASELPPVIRLDPAALARAKHETDQVSALLTGIFTERHERPADPARPAPSPQRPDGAPRRAGQAAPADAARPSPHGHRLDSTHRLLLDSLTRSASWTQAAFAELCARQDLLPRGAAAVLNEAAQLACGEPLLDGTDPYAVNDFALHEMTRTG